MFPPPWRPCGSTATEAHRRGIPHNLSARTSRPSCWTGARALGGRPLSTRGRDHGEPHDLTPACSTLRSQRGRPRRRAGGCGAPGRGHRTGRQRTRQPNPDLTPEHRLTNGDHGNGWASWSPPTGDRSRSTTHALPRSSAATARTSTSWPWTARTSDRSRRSAATAASRRGPPVGDLIAFASDGADYPSRQGSTSWLDAPRPGRRPGRVHPLSRRQGHAARLPARGGRTWATRIGRPTVRSPLSRRTAPTSATRRASTWSCLVAGRHREHVPA